MLRVNQLVGFGGRRRSAGGSNLLYPFRMTAGSDSGYTGYASASSLFGVTIGSLPDGEPAIPGITGINGLLAANSGDNGYLYFDVSNAATTLAALSGLELYINGVKYPKNGVWFEKGSWVATHWSGDYPILNFANGVTYNCGFEV